MGDFDLDKIELDLENPIFALYINIGGFTRQRAAEILQQYNNLYARYTNITVWIIAREQGETKMECLYDGSLKNRNMEILHIAKEINSRVDILSNSHDFDDFKINIRDWRLNSIIENGTQEK
jgi:hypothetical protein